MIHKLPSGVSTTIPNTSTPLKILKKFLTDELIATIITETNRYAHQYIIRGTISSHSRVNGWKVVETDETDVELSGTDSNDGYV